nr:hypothetical protein [Tanacetum cinerariifolium]
MTESPLVNSSFTVPVFSPRDDPIACLNKAMAFLTVVASLRFPSTNNQLRTSLNPRNQATIQGGRVTVQQVQERQGQIYSGTWYKSNATSSGGNNLSGHVRVVKCYNCQGEGHMARQCTQPKLTEDFGKRFTPQQELSVEQAFWLRMSDPTSKPSDALPVKIEAPKKLPKISLVNESLKKLKFYLAKFDNVMKIRTPPNARTEGEWGFKHTKAVFNNEIISFLKSLKDIFIVFDRDLLNEIMEVHTVFDQMNVVVQRSSIDKQCLEIAKKELLLEVYRLLKQIMSQDVLSTMINSMSLIGESMNIERKRNESYDKCFNLDAELLKSQNANNNLLKRSYLFMFKIRALMRLTLVRKRLLSHQKKRTRKLGLKCSTSNCISKPTDDKKNDRISRTTSRNMKNKVEAQPKNVNKKNRVVEPIRNVDIKQSQLNANSEPIVLLVMYSLK